ncbi:Fpg/Nei family DNA glycosylase [Nesterenkonia jeotgali]|uniref:DNA-(apurinic or apyrimidinic site) lyase n=1 Tax=Nesterenkonia jeotgali TaxID=317018 RepID=A0A839FT77_9MICC|nr:Fpg/Nei family DNA glycosylase [Nesterenkonia jeotgali]MBA8922789.1 endonuclease-8 [Nesterenkonia jeotgali]
MPEGDTVFRQAAVLHAALGGKVLTSSDFRVPSYATVDLSGRTVERVIARGKHLLMQFGDLTVQSHLKMEGTWHVYPRDEQGGRPRWRRPAHTARCVLRTQDQEAVGFSLGELSVLSPAEEAERLAHLGPDLLGPDWDAAEATRRLFSAPQRSIGVALLDQRNLAGVGNVFRSEICFLAGILPTRPVEEVANLARVIELSEKLLTVNRLRIRRCTTANPTSGPPYWVYGRGGKPCMRCGTRVRKSELGEGELRKAAVADRVIYFCPSCQS